MSVSCGRDVIFWKSSFSKSDPIRNRFLTDFGWILGFEKASNFEAEVGRRKSDFRNARGDSGGGSGGPIIDR